MALRRLNKGVAPFLLVTFVTASVIFCGKNHGFEPRKREHGRRAMPDAIRRSAQDGMPELRTFFYTFFTAYNITTHKSRLHQL